MLSEALSRGLLPFLPQLPNLHGLSSIQALNSGTSLASPTLAGQSDRINSKHRCNLCGFESDNAADYEGHLNTHFEHRCPYCDYTSKTEGRLKRHVKDFHEALPSTENAASTFASSIGPGSQHSESDDSSSLQNVISSGGSGQGTGNCGSLSGGSGQQKPRISKCKTCGFVAETKTEFWEHSKMHIKQGKMLECPQCPFVTEYKHHLEYHLRNHFGSKPFKCAKCNYSCVNKSMLNSHMKSHSNVYQYRCEDCNYATKYCHSLKLHLRKYGHKPAVVLNPDGTPNPYPIIDVYGTRRGPRPKKGAPGSSPRDNVVSSNSLLDPVAGGPLPLLQTPLADVASLLRTTGNWMNFPFSWGSTGDSADGSTVPPNATTELGLLTSQVSGHTTLPSEDDTDCETTHLETTILSEIASSMTELSTEEKNVTGERTDDVNESSHDFSDLRRSPTSTIAMPTPEQSENDIENVEHSGNLVKSEPIEWNMDDLPLDLSTAHSPVLLGQEKVSKSLPLGESSLSSDSSDPRHQSPPTPVDSMESPTKSSDRPRTPSSSPIEVTAAPPSSSSRRKGRAVKLETFQCDFCDMLFKDADMFSIHMNYHGFEDPFKCHVCGHQTTNRLDFFVHLTRDPHN